MTPSRQLPPFLDWPSRHERILTLASRLSADLEALDLDEVDGEFFWRICMDDYPNPEWRLAVRVAPSVVAEAFQPCAGAPKNPAGLSTHRDASNSNYRQLEDWMRMARQSFSDLPGVQALFAVDREDLPEHIWDQFLCGEWIGMHPPPVVRETEQGGAIEVLIFSQKWAGEHLEALIRPLRGEPTTYDADQAMSTVALHIDFTLVKRWERRQGLRTTIASGGTEVPQIRITLPHPLPPEGVVGREYDLIVREGLQWHRSLRGGELRQEKEVAVRTWALGLLMKEGSSFVRAYHELEDRLGPFELSQEGDRQARQRLLKRVPYARRFLGARWTLADTLQRPWGPLAVCKCISLRQLRIRMFSPPLGSG